MFQSLGAAYIRNPKMFEWCFMLWDHAKQSSTQVLVSTASAGFRLLGVHVCIAFLGIEPLRLARSTLGYIAWESWN